MHMGLVISVTNQKGGVGKTMTASSLASLLTKKGYRILTIDMDPQCNFDDMAGGPGAISQYDTESLSILQVLKQECTMQEAIVQTDIGDLVRASPNLSQWIGRSMLSRRDFKKVLDEQWDGQKLMDMLNERYLTGWGAMEHKTLDWELKDIRNTYDFILLDTNPSLTLLTLNSLYTADYVLIPAFTEESSKEAILQLDDTIQELKQSNPEMEGRAKLLGILITKYEPRTSVAAFYKELYEEMAAELGTILFEAKIRSCVAIRECGNARKDLIHYAPKSTAAIDYTAFAQEFLNRVNELEKGER